MESHAKCVRDIIALWHLGFAAGISPIRIIRLSKCVYPCGGWGRVGWRHPVDDETSEKQKALKVEGGSLELARRLIRESREREMRRRSDERIQQAKDRLDEEEDWSRRWSAAYSRRRVA